MALEIVGVLLTAALDLFEPLPDPELWISNNCAFSQRIEEESLRCGHGTYGQR